jgi:hypothetical protein
VEAAERMSTLHSYKVNFEKKDDLSKYHDMVENIIIYGVRPRIPLYNFQVI